jgi:hypothetical protein
VNRDIGDGSAHQWRAEMAEDGAWLCLEWGKKQTLGRSRSPSTRASTGSCSLSGEDGTLTGQVRGPQPETVRDYVLEVKDGGKWREIARNTGNFLRLVRHGFGTPVKTRALRLRVARTNGDPHARVFEVRCR